MGGAAGRPNVLGMATILDYSAGVPRAADVKAAGHVGVIRYISPPREAWMKGKPLGRAEVDDMRAHGLGIACVWQYGAGNAKDSDIMRGARGGELDAKAADEHLKAIGLEGHPVFFAADFDIKLAQWNSVAVEYFRAAGRVLGKERVGIYGHARVCDWAREDGVIGSAGGGKYLMWQTKSWSQGVIHPLAVLYQHTHNVPGPDGVQVDVNEIRAEFWGQRKINSGNTGGIPQNVTVTNKETPVQDTELKKYLTVQPDYVKLMQKHFTPGRGGRKIRFIVRHHLAGVGTTDDVWRWWQTRPASAHYVVENSGRIGQLVWDRDTAWASLDANAESIAIEHANYAGGAQDYPINETVIREGARWAAALCLFYGLGRPNFGTNIRDHREFGSTSCPHHLARGGKYHDAWMREAQTFYDRLVAAKQGNVAAPEPPASAPNTKETNMLERMLESIINPVVKISVEGILRLLDAYAWKNEVAMRHLYSQLGLDYDKVINDAIERDRRGDAGQK